MCARAEVCTVCRHCLQSSMHFDSGQAGVILAGRPTLSPSFQLDPNPNPNMPSSLISIFFIGARGPTLYYLLQYKVIFS